MILKSSFDKNFLILFDLRFSCKNLMKRSIQQFWNGMKRCNLNRCHFCEYFYMSCYMLSRDSFTFSKILMKLPATSRFFLLINYKIIKNKIGTQVKFELIRQTSYLFSARCISFVSKMHTWTSKNLARPS